MAFCSSCERLPINAPDRAGKRPVLVKKQQAAGDFDKLAGLTDSERDTDAGAAFPGAHI